MKTAELMEPEARTVNGENVVQMPDGLLGFEQVKNYVLLENPKDRPFMWLQMLDSANKAFLVIQPFLILSDYSPDISTEDVEDLGLANAADALVINIVTLRGNNSATVNLKGPIIINRHTLVGKQVIPNNASKFSLTHPLTVS